MRIRFFCALAAISSSAVSSFSFGETLTVRIPPPESDKDTRYKFPVDLLEKVLQTTEKEFGPWKIEKVSSVMNSSRKLLAVANGEVDLIWTTTSIEKEQKNLPVRIPIDKGLLGHRLFMINKNRQNDWGKVNSLSDLTKFVLGQGKGWIDIQILEKAGFKVESVPYESLFSMLPLKRLDGVPRSVVEIFDEYEERKADTPDIAVEKNLVLIYPFCQYFFVNKEKGVGLAKRVEKGLLALIDSGEFDTFWFSHPVNQLGLQRVNFPSRKIFRIENPFMPPETPLAVKKYWIDVSTLK